MTLPMKMCSKSFSRELTGSGQVQRNQFGSKARRILKALARGRTCEQVLAENPTLTYHEIFRLAAELPTSFWIKNSVNKASQGSPSPGSFCPKPMKHVVD